MLNVITNTKRNWISSYMRLINAKIERGRENFQMVNGIMEKRKYAENKKLTV